MNIIKAKKQSPVSGSHYLSSQRLSGLDLARILAMIMMIQGHVIYALAAPDAVDISIWPWDIWHYVRGLTAPVFLTVSGAVNVFANKRNEKGKLPTKTIFRRSRMALLLMAIGYMLMFPVERIWDIMFVPMESWMLFFQVNILQLFGVSLLMLLLLYITTRKDTTLGIISLIIGLLISLLTPTAHNINWGDFLPPMIAAFFSTNSGSIFPIFPFSAFIFFGAAFGVLLKQVKPENRTIFTIRWALPIGLIIFGGGYLIMNYQGQSNIINLTMYDYGLNLIRFGFVLAVLSATSFIYYLLPGLGNIYSLFSKRALFIYVCHLFLLYGTALYNGVARIAPNTLNLNDTLIAVVVIEVISLAMAYFYEYSIRKYPFTKRLYFMILAAYLIYALVI